MGTRDARVDAYVAKSAEFARPILEHLRAVVHAACPEARETIKWGFPHFEYHGILCSMAAFKAHCAFGFWKGSRVVDRDPPAEKAMGQFGRITRVEDLPSQAELTRLVKKAMSRNESAGSEPPKPRVKKAAAPLIVPDDLVAALQNNPRARATFEKFPPSHRREYVEWITGAKTQPTRERRLATALEWMAEGKPQNWKYMNKAKG